MSDQSIEIPLSSASPPPPIGTRSLLLSVSPPILPSSSGNLHTVPPGVLNTTNNSNVVTAATASLPSREDRNQRLQVIIGWKLYAYNPQFLTTLIHIMTLLTPCIHF